MDKVNNENEKKIFIKRKEIRDKIKRIVQRQLEYGIRSWEYHSKGKELNEWIVFRKQITEGIKEDGELIINSVRVSKYLSKEWEEVKSNERKDGKGKIAKLMREKQLFNKIKKEVEEKEEITIRKIMKHRYYIEGIGEAIIMSINENRLYNI